MLFLGNTALKWWHLFTWFFHLLIPGSVDIENSLILCPIFPWILFLLKREFSFSIFVCYPSVCFWSGGFRLLSFLTEQRFYHDSYPQSKSWLKVNCSRNNFSSQCIQTSVLLQCAGNIQQEEISIWTPTNFVFFLSC